MVSQTWLRLPGDIRIGRLSKMREVLPGVLWIGNARDAHDVSGILAQQFVAVVDLAMEEAPAQFPRDIIHCRFPLLDGEGNLPGVLRAAILTIASLIEAKLKTLVTCSGGMSRSPAVVAAAIARVKGVSLEESLKSITATGPHDIAPALWDEVRSCVLGESGNQ